ncbi:hypothetical protein EVAR_10135_1 [Eumeta japonica]|uniref:Uncharacterized protein n=1 Tax=Eumeta variegata TaxID=151549 RepID=A0A4C1UDN4_EUMVA|nr:hypothetical protein EVAR_10135_1 [Eumeta japonica]
MNRLNNHGEVLSDTPADVKSSTESEFCSPRFAPPGTRHDEWRTSSPQSHLDLPIPRYGNTSPPDTMGLVEMSPGRDFLAIPESSWGHNFFNFLKH